MLQEFGSSSRWRAAHVTMLTPTHRRAVPALALLLSIVVAACDSGPTEPRTDLERLSGAWEATRLDITDSLDPTFTFDLVEVGGSYRLDVQASGLYALTVTFVGETRSETGIATFEGGELDLTAQSPAPRVDRFTFSFGESARSLALSGPVVLDITGDGINESGTIDGVLEKR